MAARSRCKTGILIGLSIYVGVLLKKDKVVLRICTLNGHISSLGICTVLDMYA